jgi:CheY-like chemotaxis protein
MAAKVLVVEDDSFLIKAYVAKLTNSGFELRTASDGEEALKVLQEFKPDVVLMDLVMPRKDGFSTLEDMQKDDTLKNIPVIVTSNLAQQEALDRAKALGAVDFITKSNMSMEDLLKKINKVVGA